MPFDANLWSTLLFWVGGLWVLDFARLKLTQPSKLSFSWSWGWAWQKLLKGKRANAALESCGRQLNINIPTRLQPNLTYQCDIAASCRPSYSCEEMILLLIVKQKTWTLIIWTCKINEKIYYFSGTQSLEEGKRLWEMDLQQFWDLCMVP